MDSEPLYQNWSPLGERDIGWGRPGRSRCLFDSRLWLYRQMKKLGEGGVDYGKAKRSLRSFAKLARLWIGSIKMATKAMSIFLSYTMTTAAHKSCSIPITFCLCEAKFGSLKQKADSRAAETAKTLISSRQKSLRCCDHI